MGVSERTMRTLRYDPNLPVMKIAGRNMWLPDDMDAYLALCKEAV